MSDDRIMAREIQRLLRERYQRLDEANEIEISPRILAQQCYEQEIDPEGVAPARGRWCAIMELRQLARAACRDGSGETSGPDGQSDLFDGELQPRYPAHRTDEVYVPREHMTREEYQYNVRRLRAEGEAKLRHADALEAEMRRRFPQTRTSREPEFA